MAKWIRLEYKEAGNLTGYQELDLDQVKRLQVGRVDGKMEHVMIFLQDEPGSAVALDAYAGEAFLREWAKHTGTQGGVVLANEESKPGLIQVAGDKSPRKLLGM